MAQLLSLLVLIYAVECLSAPLHWLNLNLLVHVILVRVVGVLAFHDPVRILLLIILDVIELLTGLIHHFDALHMVHHISTTPYILITLALVGVRRRQRHHIFDDVVV